MRQVELRGALLATSSVVALVLGMEGSAQAAVPCQINNQNGAINNTATINCISFNSGATFTGPVTNTNTGTLTGPGSTPPTQTGITVVGGSTVTGNITNAGTISASRFGIDIAVGAPTFSNAGSVGGSITNALGGKITGGSYGIYMDKGPIGGSVINDGLISVALNGIHLEGAGVPAFTTVGGSITNTGKISTVVNSAVYISHIAVGGSISNTGTLTSTSGFAGMQIVNGGSVAGNVSNSGTITNNSTSSNIGIYLGQQQVTGSVTNATGGTITAGYGIVVTGSFAAGQLATVGGNVSNQGTINANIKSGIAIFSGTTVTGAIQNLNGGQITAVRDGILVVNTSSNVAAVPVVGGISNSGTIASNGSGFAGITVAGGSVSNGITNATGGSLNATNGAGILVSNGNAIFTNTGASTVTGGILNQGSITAKTGIVVGGLSTVAGGITNSGNISGSRAAIDLATIGGGEGAATTINQQAGTITGAILLSTLADTVNVTGGAISGNIVGQGSSNTVNFALGAGNTFTYANSITGVNAVNVNTGTLQLNGTIGPTALTINSAGTLVVGAGGSIAGNVTDKGVFAVNRSGVFSYGGIISGTGVFQQLGSGTTVLSGVNTYSGGTTISAGVVQVKNSTPGTSSSVGTGAVTLNGGTFQAGANNLTFSNAFALNTAGGSVDTNSNTLTLSGAMANGNGAGALTKIGAGTLILTGTNSYSGGTTITAGTLQLGNGGTTGSILGDVVDNGTFAINHSNTFTFGNAISGTGAFAQNGTGITVLTGTNTYGGGTTITAGTLQLGNAGTTGSILGDVVDNGTFAINHSNAFTFGGAISGTGGFAQNGTGTTILTGTSTYSGATSVNAGMLVVNGSIANSAVTVNSGTALSGTGTVGNTTIAGNGGFAPGSGAPGTSMTVSGNLAFQSGALYLVTLNPTTASFANVTGTATLGGATVNAIYANGSYVAKKYTILTATGAVSGAFGPLVNTNLPANFSASLSYDAHDVFLDLTMNFIPPPNSGLNQNQQNVANAIVGFFNANGGIPLVFGGLTPAGLTQVAGETATGSQQTTFDAMNKFIGLISDPFITGRGDPLTSSTGAPGFAEENDSANAYAAKDKARSKSERDAYAAIYRKAPPMADTFAQRWSVWAVGFGGSQTTDGNAVLGSNTATSRVYGTAVGADYRFSPFTLAGFALAGGGTNFSVNGLGSGRSDLFQAGAFIRHTVGPAYITGALAYGWQDITTDRTVTIAGVDRLRARFNANAYSGRVEGGYRFVTPWMMGITPYAAGQFTTFQLPAYAEQVLSGANTFALAYGSKSVTASRSELGVRTDKSWAMTDSIFTLRGRFAWAHDFNSDRNIAATFQTLPGASFVVNGAAQAHDAALTTASAEMKWLNGWSAAAAFEGEFSDVTRSYAGKGVVRYAW